MISVMCWDARNEPLFLKHLLIIFYFIQKAHTKRVGHNPRLCQEYEVGTILRWVGDKVLEDLDNNLAKEYRS